MVDKTLNRLLLAWGRARTSEYLSYPRICPYLREYISRGPAEPPAYDSDEVDHIGHLIDTLLDRRQTEALKCLYRYRINKRMSAKHLNCTRDEYMEYFESGIRILEQAE